MRVAAWLIDSCRFCARKFRHRDVATSHVWREHQRRINCPSRDMASTKLNSRSAVSSSSLINAAQPCLASKKISAAETDVDPQYKFRLVPSSTDISCRPKGFDRQGPQISSDLPSKEVVCFQSSHSKLSRPWASAVVGCHRKRGNTLGSLTALVSSFSGSSPPPSHVVDYSKLESSSEYGSRPAACHPATRLQENSGSASFQKHVESTSCVSAVGPAVSRFACPLCSLSYKRVADLNRHMKQKHLTQQLPVFNSSKTATASSSGDRPLNLTLKNTTSAHRVLGQHHGQWSPGLPLDLSTGSRRSKRNGGGLTEPPSDRECRVFSSQPLSSFVVDDSLPKNSDSQTPSSNCSSQPSSTTPSFYTSFAKFVENAYNPPWKSHVDGVLGRNSNDERPGNGSSAANDFGDGIKRMNVDLISANSKMIELSRPACFVDDNNNISSISNSGHTGRRSVSAEDAQLLASMALESGESRGLNEGRLWGRCPLCPFVCPHPLVMRRHLDVHDEPELQQSTQSSRHVGASFNADLVPSGRAVVTGFEVDSTACRRSCVFSCPNFDGRMSTSVSSPSSLAWSSAQSWTPVCPLPTPGLTPGAAGRFIGWNSTSGYTVNSPCLQAASGQTMVPWSFQEPGKTEDPWGLSVSREYWQGSEQSKTKKDAMKDMYKVHSTGGHVITATSSAFNAATLPSWSSFATNPPHITTPTVPTPLQTDAVGWWRGWAPREHLLSSWMGLQNQQPVASAAAVAVHASRKATRSRPLRAADFKLPLNTRVGILQHFLFARSQ